MSFGVRKQDTAKMLRPQRAVSKRANPRHEGQTVDTAQGVARFGLSDPASKAGHSATVSSQPLQRAGADTADEHFIGLRPKHHGLIGHRREVWLPQFLALSLELGALFGPALLLMRKV